MKVYAVQGGDFFAEVFQFQADAEDYVAMQEALAYNRTRWRVYETTLFSSFEEYKESTK